MSKETASLQMFCLLSKADGTVWRWASLQRCLGFCWTVAFVRMSAAPSMGLWVISPCFLAQIRVWCCWTVVCMDFFWQSETVIVISSALENPASFGSPHVPGKSSFCWVRLLLLKPSPALRLWLSLFHKWMWWGSSSATAGVSNARNATGYRKCKCGLCAVIRTTQRQATPPTECRVTTAAVAPNKTILYFILCGIYSLCLQVPSLWQPASKCQPWAGSARSKLAICPWKGIFCPFISTTTRFLTVASV